MIRVVFISIIAAVLLAACGASLAASPESDYRSLDQGAPLGNAPEQVFAPPEAPAAEAGGGNNAVAIERVVLKNADIAIVVSNVEQRLQAIDAMAKEMGGYVVSSNLYRTVSSNYDEVPEATIVIRVPENRLDEALQRIKDGTVEVQSETRSGQDVTADYVDLQSRLKNLEAAEAQLQEILDNAQDTEDVINVFNQLVSYREQIELVKGQLKYYDEAAALSAVSVRIIAEETVQPLVIGKWEPKGIYLEAVKDLIDFLQDFASFLIRFFIYNLPVLILVAIPLYLIFLGVRAVARRMRKPGAGKTETTAPKK
jgi:hypothetical protein